MLPKGLSTLLRKKSAKSKLKKFFFPSILLCASLGLIAVPSLISIEAVICQSQFGPCRENITLSLQEFKGKSFRKTKGQIESFLRGEAAVEKFSLRLKLPSTIMVTILEKKTRFALKQKNAEIYANLSAAGEVLAIESLTPLPVVVISVNPPNLGEKVAASTLFALKIQERMFSAYQVKEGEIVDDSLKVLFNDGYTVFFPLKGDIDEIMGALSLIIYELKRPEGDSRIEGTKISTIDLRFTNPVLR